MRVANSKKSKAHRPQEKNGRRNRGGGKGRISVVGIGPGDRSLMSAKAVGALKSCDVVVGYKTYLNLLGDLVSGKEVVSSGMMQEEERVRGAIRAAQEGNSVCLVSSGDPGVYGMAGLLLEMLSASEAARVPVEIIPGITAATSCAAILGAPLMHDFAVISLSDLLTDIKLIERRVKKAAEADLVIVFFNPKSVKRTLPLDRAWQILMKTIRPDTPVGIVRNAGRDGEEATITVLKDLLSIGNIDMVTTIIVGNSQTYTKGGRMITPRGYGNRGQPLII